MPAIGIGCPSPSATGPAEIKGIVVPAVMALVVVRLGFAEVVFG